MADKKVYAKIVSLIKDVQREPFSGLGKPEALKHELSGLWSRRITKEHCLVYSVSDYDTKARTSGSALQGCTLQRGRNEKKPLLINFPQK
ncbi:Txe/YoeB family addiction module toxin [Microcystis aeruginosa]|uniref:Txe/YoeB family addiction module toxin n=1 Tax=Microcystis aeruginosa TaxID=1126 RepID=UPI00133019EF|nr:Txe/YoeB family addiction module toxin [Microcystis aeruginosa]